MKTIFQIIILMLITQIAITQNNCIKINQLFITNKITGKSIKIGAPISTLKNFGTLIRTDSVNPYGYVEDVIFMHTYSNIAYTETTRGTISSFETTSSEIAIEVKGKFSISPGDNIDDVRVIFPSEGKNASLINMTNENKSYLLMTIYFLGYNQHSKKYFENYDEGISLLFNPETKVLEKILSWTRP